jgi:hypothetical protein
MGYVDFDKDRNTAYGIAVGIALAAVVCVGCMVWSCVKTGTNCIMAPCVVVGWCTRPCRAK